MISIVIPAYNESVNIVQTIQEICTALAAIKDSKGFEILVIDDHSTDKTYERVAELKDERFKAFRLSHRCGSVIALRAGMREAKGDVVICISADGQDDPQAIPQMIEKWRQHADVVWALRNSRHSEPFFVKLPALIFYKILNWMTPEKNGSIDLSRADFYLMDRKVVDAMNDCKENNTSLFGLIVWSGFNQNFVEYERKQRRLGASKWNFRSRMKLAKDWIIAFSGLPLRLMVWIGFAIALLGFAYALFVLLVHIFYGHPVQGWSSIMVVMLILGGINIAMMGVIGEYLWRNLEESRKRPLYFIEKKSTDKN